MFSRAVSSENVVTRSRETAGGRWPASKHPRVFEGVREGEGRRDASGLDWGKVHSSGGTVITQDIEQRRRLRRIITYFMTFLHRPFNLPGSRESPRWSRDKFGNEISL